MTTLAGRITATQTTILDNTIVPVALEMMRIFPDGIVIASGIYALITMSTPYAVFFASMIESTVAFRFIQWVAAYVNSSSLAPSVASLTNKCRTGFMQPTATMNSLSMFSLLGSPFPSAPIFMLATASSYIFTTLSLQSKELEALGPAYSSRYYISLVFLFMLLFLFCAFRMAYECDSFGVIMLTLPIALVLGVALVFQNQRLFGATSVNLLGIPILQNRTANGQTIYVCPK